MKVNYCGKEQQARMIKNGWKMMLANDYQETPEAMHDRLVARGYKEVRVYWIGTMIRGIHSYFAFVK